MLIFRRARGTVGRSLGVVTQALECLAAEGQQLEQTASVDRGASQCPAAQHVGCHTPLIRMYAATGKAGGEGGPGPGKQEATEEGGGKYSEGAAGSSTSESSTQDEEDADTSEQEFQNVLLTAALKHVVTEGWTTRALQKAAQDLRLSPMFAGVCSEKDLVKHFIKTCNESLFERIRSSGAEFHSLPVPDKVKLAVRWRLEMLAPYINTWPQAMAIMAQPQNVRSALYLLWSLISKLAQHIEPKDAEAVRYSNVFALQAVYTSTELYMLTDFSPGHADTWQALDRRVADLAFLRSGGQQLEQLVLEQVNKMATFGRP